MYTIAIDGPAGSGKSTVSKIISNKLNINYLDTGAMYRACTLKVMNEEIDFENIEEIKKIIESIDLTIKNNSFYLDGKNIDKDIRKPCVSRNVSKIAAIAFVREKMVKLQREIANEKSVIMDGRDIGTHVLKNSRNKFFLNASIEERARRRYDELLKKGENVSIKSIENSIKERDEKDSKREISPLTKAPDAIEVDTTKMSIEEVVEFIIKKVDLC